MSTAITFQHGMPVSHRTGTVYAAYTATVADTALNACGTFAINLPANPLAAQVISITNTCTGTITVNGNGNLVGALTAITILPGVTTLLFFDTQVWNPITANTMPVGTAASAGSTQYASAASAQTAIASRLANLNAAFANQPWRPTPLPGTGVIAGNGFTFTASNGRVVTYNYTTRAGALNVYHASMPGGTWSMDAYGITSPPGTPGVTHYIGPAHTYSLTSAAEAINLYFPILDGWLPATLPEVNPFYGAFYKDSFFFNSGGFLGLKYASTNPGFSHIYGAGSGYTTDMTALYYVDFNYTVS